MISAKEARGIVETSESVVAKYLDKIDTLVRHNAAEGKTSLFLYIEGLWAAEEVSSTYNKVATPIQVCVIRALKNLGYHAAYGSDSDPKAMYVPRGLANDDGSGPMYINCGITIKW